MLLLSSKEWSLRYLPGRGNPGCCVVAPYVGGGVGGGEIQEGTMPLAQLSAGFQSFLPLSTRKLGPSGADS